MTQAQLTKQIMRLYYRWLQTDDVRYWLAHQRLRRERRTVRILRAVNGPHD